MCVCSCVCVFARQTTPVVNSVVEPVGVPADAIPTSSMAVGAAPPSESQVAASAGGGGGGGGGGDGSADALPVAAVPLGNGSGGKVSVAKVRMALFFLVYSYVVFLLFFVVFLCTGS